MSLEIERFSEIAFSVEPRSLLLTLARSNVVEIEKIQFVREYIQNSIPLDVLYRDPESNSGQFSKIILSSQLLIGFNKALFWLADVRKSQFYWKRFSAVGVAASRREDRLAEVFGETLKHIETQIIEETKIKKIQKELKVIKHKNHRNIFTRLNHYHRA